MKELWTALAHLLTPPEESGDTKCFTYVVAWAEDPDDFASTIATIFARRQWSVLRLQKIKRAAACTVMTAELAEQIERAKVGPDTCIIGVRCYYPSKTA